MAALFSFVTLLIYKINSVEVGLEGFCSERFKESHNLLY